MEAEPSSPARTQMDQPAEGGRGDEAGAPAAETTGDADPRDRDSVAPEDTEAAAIESTDLGLGGEDEG